jgi:membrane-bound hydrogenase subunit beta
MDLLTPEEIIESFKSAMGDSLTDSRIYQTEVALKKNKFTTITLCIKPESLKDAVEHLCTLQEYPHLCVASSDDMGDSIELIYHFTIYYGFHLKEISVLISMILPKDNLKVQTITDIIPGAIFTERETQEMMGITVEGIPDNRRLFIPDDFPDGVYPWRRDDTGPEDMLRVLPGRKGIQNG